ncbi:hypothetical protein [Leucobacter musarum]|uniref:hypothetical protein n=1 Tax=Leucobacter musarum TaxID=1930747 RepID=UPI0006A7ADB1|nr:hypothetical protein [Leucobacter musarum]
MNTKPVLPDFDAFFDALITAAVPDTVTAIQDQHADSYDEVPFVSWTAINQGQYDYGLWNVTLVLNLLAAPRDVFGHSAHLYAAIQNWSIPGEGVMPEIAAINTVEDASVFDKVSEIRLPGKHLSQAVATFRLTVQDLT